MSDRLLMIDPASVAAEAGAPAPERLIEGTPVFTTWNVEDDGQGLYAGIWRSTPGQWAIEYTEWEFCHIISGVSIVSEEGGEAVTLREGDSFVIRPGFKGCWTVVETTVKHYVVKL